MIEPKDWREGFHTASPSTWYHLPTDLKKQQSTLSFNNSDFRPKAVILK